MPTLTSHPASARAWIIPSTSRSSLSAFGLITEVKWREEKWREEKWREEKWREVKWREVKWREVTRR